MTYVRLSTLAVMIVLLPTAALVAEPGVVVTQDGQVYRGEIKKDADSVTVTHGGKPTRLPMAKVKSARTKSEIEADYSKRQAATKSDDLNAQVELLRWCDEQGWPDVIVRQAQAVLRLKSDQGEARASLKKAGDIMRAMAAEEKGPKKKPGEMAGDEPAEGEEPAADGETGPTRKLNKAEINRIKFMELRALREKTGPDVRDVPVDNVRVGIPKAVIDDFLKEMVGTDGYKGTEGKERFLKLTPERKLAEIAYSAGGDKYIDRIDIKTDPETFMTFKTKVLPTIIRGCATAACHGGADAAKTGLKLFDDPKHTTESTYTNFLLLDEYELDHEPMLDRDRPERSLLLVWLLREDKSDNRIRHPGSTKLKPVFQNTVNPGYKGIYDWIRTLRLPHPDYGVYLKKKPAPASAPADGDDKMMEKP